VTGERRARDCDRLGPLIVVLAEGGECVEESRVGVGLAVEDPDDDGLGAGEHGSIVVVGIGGRH
jgi:hypothetical protein